MKIIYPALALTIIIIYLIILQDGGKEDALGSLVAEYVREVSKLPQQELTVARLERDQPVSAELYAK